MKKTIIAAVLGIAFMQACTTVPPPPALGQAVPAAVPPAPAPVIVQAPKPVVVEMNGKVLFENNNLGNCLACHGVVKYPEYVAGNIGPPFVAMKERFTDPAKLRAIIHDQQVNNPDTIMPPFGRNKVLTAEQIDVLANYILQF